MAEASYQNGGVSIDDDFARFGSKSYALDKINTVDVRIKRASRASAIVLWCLAGLLLLSWIGGAGVGAMAAGVLFAAIGYLLFRGQRDQHQLFLVTSSSEAQAFKSYDRAEVMALREAVEAAMTRQRQRR